jgi:hypothetical protein
MWDIYYSCKTNSPQANLKLVIIVCLVFWWLAGGIGIVSCERGTIMSLLLLSLDRFLTIEENKNK